MITFRSVTPAQRGERILQQAGIGCQLQRTPKKMEEKGCGYCLQLPCHLVQTAVEQLRNREVPFRKVYLNRENGIQEELYP
jgi:hypothetical protein